ncbi:Mechanosensitive ion channel [Bacteroides luti]|jgi:small-conductance mechanosensitive channel|uniref:Mechanosensitive ion channel n=1 Tax=Bacteroides luti TaxID=1297750 RepID=A0A1M4WW23_9BACE|nr:mechanosensitive ion channel family protein [Bacteroides luti]SHE85410.1 Mechanosensitive ion channel [Bacteroides luti]
MNVHEFLSNTILNISIEKLISFFIKALLIYGVTQVAVSFTKYLFRRSQKRKKLAILDQTTSSFIQRLIVYTLYIIGMAIFLSLIPGMEKVSSSILAGAGIMAMAVGFASQEALSNFVSGLFIVFGKPFRIGDSIMIDSVVNGTVAEITLRHTIIKSLDNRMIIIPNSKINSSTIVNSTIGEQDTCSFIEVGVSYDTNLDKAINVMRDEIMHHPLLIDRRTPEEKQGNTPQVVIRVIALGDSAITLKAWAWAANAGNAFVLKCDLLKSIKERFDKENIEIPYPYNNVIVKK